MTAQLAPLPVFRGWDNNGNPLYQGQLFSYVSGTTTPQATYTDSTQSTPNTNPVILNARGECNLWLDPTLTYKLLLKDSLGNQIWSVDNIPGGFAPSAIIASLIPAITNTYTLGNSTHSWAQLYLGASAAPAYDSITGNIGYYARTATEVTAGVTPTNFTYAPGPYIDARRYGADPTGAADSTTAIQNAINVAQATSNGATVILAPGTFKVTSQLVISSNRIRLIGCGMYATQILFAPIADGICIKLINGSTEITQCSLSDFAVWSSDSTHTKTAIDITDASNCDYERIVIGGTVVAGAASFWSGGTGSIGIRTRGRDTSGFRAITAFCDKPLVISVNPHSSISIDHHNFHDCFLGGNGNPIVTIEAGVTLTQVSFTGFQAWVLGTGGLYWVDGTSPGSSNGLTIENLRYEGSTDVTKYVAQIDVTSPLQMFVMRGGQAGACRGFHLRNVQQANFDSFFYTDNTKEAFNADNTCSQIYFKSCVWQNGSTATLTSLMVVQSDPTPSSEPVPGNGFLMPTGSFYLETRDETSSGTPVTLAASGTVQVGLGSQLGMIVVTDESTQVVATFFLKGTNHQTVLGPVSDAGFFTITSGNANTINCYWDGGTHYVVQNGYATSKTVRISGKVGKT